MAQDENSARWWTPAHIAAFLPALFCVAAAVLLFPASGKDDAYLTYWPAEALAEYGAILNYNGERVEQSSSLLLVFFFALLRLCGIAHLPDMARVASLVFAVITLWYVQGGASGVLRKRRGKLVAGGLIATAPSFVYWSTSGMESSLAALLAVIAAGRFIHVLTEGLGSRWQLVSLIGATGAFLLVRPEAFVVLLCVTSALAASPLLGRVFPRARILGLVPHRRARILFLTVAVSTAAMIFWRLWYFGVPIPQPAIAKAGLDWHTVVEGLDYLVVGHCFWLPTLATSLGAALLLLVRFDDAPKQALSSYVLVLFGLALGSFIVLAGGDWMEMGRFLVPLIPICAVLVGSLVERLHDRGQVRRWLAWMIGAAVLANGWGFYTAPGSGSLFFWQGGQEPSPVNFSRYTWLERTSKTFLNDMGTVNFLLTLIEGPFSSRERISFMSHQGGFVPYMLARDHYGEVVFREPNGLYDRTFLDCPYAEERYTGTAHGRGLPKVAVYSLIGEILSETMPRCGLPLPDIVYALHLPPQDVLQRLGYRVVYRGKGSWIAVYDPAGAAGREILASCPRYRGWCDRSILTDRMPPRLEDVRDRALGPVRFNGGR